MKKSVLFAALLLAATTFALADGTINIAHPSSGSGWTVSGEVVTITEGGEYVVTGSTEENRLVVGAGVTANVTLQNVSISPTAGSPLIVESNGTSGARVTLRLERENTLRGAYGWAGLTVSSAAQLTIKGGVGDLLVAQGGAGGAGIGGGLECSSGTITIKGGAIEAIGGDGAAGIGGGQYGSNGTFTIVDGKVTATGNKGGAGIGGGEADRMVAQTNGGEINLQGGVVVAYANNYGSASSAAGIGGGGQGYAGAVRITGGVVYASAGGWQGIGAGREASSGGRIEITGGTVIANQIGVAPDGSTQTETHISGIATLVLSNGINTDYFGAAGNKAIVVTGSDVSVSDNIIAGDQQTDVTLNVRLSLPERMETVVPDGILFSLDRVAHARFKEWVYPIDNRIYTGDPICPKVVIVTDAGVRLEEERDYTLSYFNNVAVGTGIVRITGKATYAADSLDAPFNILANPMPDTLRVESSLPDTFYDSIPNIVATVYDTVIVYVPIMTYDTVWFPIYDQPHITIHDTTIETVHDTVKLVKEVEVVKKMYVVYEKQTGTSYNVTTETRISELSDGVRLEGLQAGQPFVVYTVSGEIYFRGRATAVGDYVILDIPEGDYILYHVGQYSHFTRQPQTD